MSTPFISCSVLSVYKFSSQTLIFSPLSAKLLPMTAELIDGKAIADTILKKTKQKVIKLKKRGIHPHLGVILVGNDPRSITYIKKKQAAAESIGVGFSLFMFPRSTTKAELLQELKDIQKKPLTGLILQLPLPEKLYTEEVLNAIDPSIDVDFLTNANLGKLIMNQATMLPPTPGAVFSVLDFIGADIVGKEVAIVGMGSLVGKPLAVMMANARASITTINSATKDVQKKCRNADILVSGVGKKDLIRGNMIKSGAIVIDTGIVFDNGKMYGDANRAEVIKKASYFTPTPGGIGPITVARLLWNTVLCAERKRG